jgi:uncharacterized membrane protein YfcA
MKRREGSRLDMNMQWRRIGKVQRLLAGVFSLFFLGGGLLVGLYFLVGFPNLEMRDRVAMPLFSVFCLVLGSALVAAAAKGKSPERLKDVVAIAGIIYLLSYCLR